MKISDILKKHRDISTAESCMWLCAFLLFFLGLWKLLPAGIYPDTGSYIAMQTGRDPVYPLFLMIFRRYLCADPGKSIYFEWMAASGGLVAGTEAYEKLINSSFVSAALFAQNLLAAVSSFFLFRVIAGIFRTGFFARILMFFLVLTPHIMTPLASGSHMVLTNALLTEGITFSVFAVCLGFMLLYIYEREREMLHALCALASCLLLVLSRGQMLVTFVSLWCVLVIKLLVKWIRTPAPGQKMRICAALFMTVLSVPTFFILRSAVISGYNEYFRPGYTGVSTGSYNMLTTCLYLSDESFAEYLTDEGERELFRDMQKVLKERGLRMKDIDGGLLEHAYHYEDCYDIIGFEVQQDRLFNYVRRTVSDENMVLNGVVGVAAHMTGELMPKLYGRYIFNYVATALSGFTRTIAAGGRIMAVYALLMYLTSVGFVIYLFRAGKGTKSAVLMLLALFMTVVNVLATSCIIMCLSRYMIYNTALFYIAFLLCLKDIAAYYCRKKDKK